MPLEVGESAPQVTGLNQDGTELTLTYDEPTVVYFYPQDETPGCTTEACQFDAELETYREAGVRVYGISTDDVSSHRSFAEKNGLGFDLLADPDGAIASAFDVDVQNGRAGRVTFVIVNGEVQSVYTGVKPDGHARAVLMDMLDNGLVSIEW